MIEVIVSRGFNGHSAYFIDSQGYKTIFAARNSLNKLKESIKEHFDMRKENYTICGIIKKE